MEQSEDQWSTSNLGDESTLPVEVNCNSVGGKLQAILASEFQTSLTTAKSISPLIEAEVKEWETQFPNLLIQGRSTTTVEQPNYINEQITAQRLSVARRLVLTTIFPEIQKMFRDELGIHLSAPKSIKARSKSSKITTSTTTDKRETKLTLPKL